MDPVLLTFRVSVPSTEQCSFAGPWSWFHWQQQCRETLLCLSALLQSSLSAIKSCLNYYFQWCCCWFDKKYFTCFSSSISSEAILPDFFFCDLTFGLDLGSCCPTAFTIRKPQLFHFLFPYNNKDIFSLSKGTGLFFLHFSFFFFAVAVEPKMKQTKERSFVKIFLLSPSGTGWLKSLFLSSRPPGQHENFPLCM